MSSLPETANVASRHDPGRPARAVMSRIMRLIVSRRRKAVGDALRETLRRVRGAPHRVHYFHQVDDPYSLLAVQALDDLMDRYAVELTVHVTARDTGPNTPEPDLLAELALRDCIAVAPHYGLDFPGAARAPDPAAVAEVESLLVAACEEGLDTFVRAAVRAGQAIFTGDAQSIDALGGEHAKADLARTRAALAEASALRRKLGHYSGAMFLYAGEWFWGVDRLHHLERRLARLGAARVGASMRFPRPEIPLQKVDRASEMTLEVFPSLRSPYTAIGFEPTLRLAEATGVRLVVRPVLPMVMRGVPVTFAKGRYIMLDTRREADVLGMPFGRMVDPIGEPVRRAYSLWPFAREHGKGDELLASFLRGAFAEGIDTSTDAGLRRVVEAAGLDWGEATKHLGDPAWEDELESNRRAMLGELGHWGVPSFRLRGPHGEPDLCSWGQDRLWLIAQEIQRRGHPIGAPAPSQPS